MVQLGEKIRDRLETMMKIVFVKNIRKQKEYEF